MGLYIRLVWNIGRERTRKPKTRPSRIDTIPQVAQPIQLRISRPDETSPPLPGPAPTDSIKNGFPASNHQILHEPDKTRLFLEPARALQSFHRAGIVFRADVALRAVFRHDVREARGHDEDGEGGGGAPVVVDAVGGVVGVGLEVDEAAVAGPCAGQAVAGLIRAEGPARQVLAGLRLSMEIAGGADWAMTMYTSQTVLATSQGRRTKFLMTSRKVLDVDHERQVSCSAFHFVFISTRKG